MDIIVCEILGDSTARIRPGLIVALVVAGSLRAFAMGEFVPNFQVTPFLSVSFIGAKAIQYVLAARVPILLTRIGMAVGILYSASNDPAGGFAFALGLLFCWPPLWDELPPLAQDATILL